MSIDRHGSTNAVASEEDALFLDILHEAPLFGQRKPTSIGASILFCILLAGYATLAAATPWIFRPVQALISPLLCSCNVIMLVVTGIFQQYMVYQVQKIRLQGYYVFSQKLKHLVRLPFATTAYVVPTALGTALDINLSNASLVFISVTFATMCKSAAPIFLLMFTFAFRLESPSYKLLGIIFVISVGVLLTGTAAMLLVIVWKPHIFLSISVLLRIIMLIEVLCAGFFMSIYIGYIHQYNSLDSQPDVLKSLYSPLQQSSPLEGLRYHDGRLADQQMALLQYQRENLHFLSEEILRLQECLSKYERSNDGITPQVDLAHLLATRDQELRTLSAEMNQMQSELRLARSLIAERDSEIQRVRITNNQYIEENERLRAILGEWSTRAAKLERALESERMSNMELQKKVLLARHQHRSTQESTGLP